MNRKREDESLRKGSVYIRGSDRVEISKTENDIKVHFVMKYSPQGL